MFSVILFATDLSSGPTLSMNSQSLSFKDYLKTSTGTL